MFILLFANYIYSMNTTAIPRMSHAKENILVDLGHTKSLLQLAPVHRRSLSCVSIPFSSLQLSLFRVVRRRSRNFGTKNQD